MKTQRGQKTLDLSHREAVTLTMLTMIGATAFDTKNDLFKIVRDRFAERFGVDIGDRDIAGVVQKTRSLMTGDDDVSVDDDGDER